MQRRVQLRAYVYAAAVVCVLPMPSSRVIDCLGCTDAKARDVFIAELYTYLMGQVHRGINRAFAKAATGVAEGGPDGAGVPVSPTKTLTRLLNTTGKVDEDQQGPAGAPEETPSQRLLRMADEAEFLGQFDRAAKHHQDRVSRSEIDAASGKSGAYDVGVWFDYARFCLRMGDPPKAGECLRECVGIDADNVPVLLAQASVFMMQGQNDRAAVMVKGAIKLLDPPAPEEDEDGKVAPAVEPQPNDQVSTNDLAVANVLLSVALERDGESKTAGAAMLAAISAVKRTERSGDAATVRAAVDAACL